jgi:hypothetical protein
LLLEKLTSATTAPPVEFSGVATSRTTCQVFSESDVGLRMIWVTGATAVLVPLQPTRRPKTRTAKKAARTPAAG